MCVYAAPQSPSYLCHAPASYSCYAGSGSVSWRSTISWWRPTVAWPRRRTSITRASHGRASHGWASHWWTSHRRSSHWSAHWWSTHRRASHWSTHRRASLWGPLLVGLGYWRPSEVAIKGEIELYLQSIRSHVSATVTNGQLPVHLQAVIQDGLSNLLLVVSCNGHVLQYQAAIWRISL
jgi:hypothetical protein